MAVTGDDSLRSPASPALPSPADDLALALRIAQEVDALTMSQFRSADLRVRTKPDNTPVTEADLKAERAIRDLLTDERPHDSLLGEEFGEEHEADRQWIIDPIDGTKNFLRGVPVWCTLIGLRQGDSVVVGVASAPALGRRWWASAGGGAWTRDVDGSVRQLHASGVRHLADASFSYSDEVGWGSARDGLRDLIKRCWRTRAYGDFWSHVLVAEGAVDVAAEPDLKPWDLAALIPIITESGGRMTSLSGGDPLTDGSAVTTNGILHDEVLALVR
ncbi:MAG: histidinol-phosphatase [Candidatus Nanopelagicales bacterium]|nr:histidinol-phosphatase [Candidatus Nanopelagicales bacterium]